MGIVADAVVSSRIVGSCYFTDFQRPEADYRRPSVAHLLAWSPQPQGVGEERGVNGSY